MNGPPIKKIVLWLLTIFLIYAILNDPSSAADIIGGAWDSMGGGLANIGRFFDELLAG